MKSWTAVLLILAFGPVWAEDEVTELPEIVIKGDKEEASPVMPESIFKVEKVPSSELKKPRSQTVSDLVKTQAGVDTQTYCANCGAKILSINGLKGEHTSILIDDLPLHSAVSSFYGVDAIPVNGIQEVLVMRGAGASLTNPEAIGGTLGLVTIDPLDRPANFQTAWGSEGLQNHALLYSLVNAQGNLGVSFGGQYTLQEPWDEDHNHIAESPERETWSGMLKARARMGDKNDLRLRYSHAQLEILGGTTEGFVPGDLPSQEAVPGDFENGDVRNRFTGHPEKITDYIKLKRHETSVDWTHYLSPTQTVRWNSGYARQEQQSIYMHGFDYANTDDLYVTDLSTQWVLQEKHLMSAGVFYKNQQLRSASLKLYQPTGSGGLGLPKDDLNLQSTAVYLQDTWMMSEAWELDLAFRLDHLQLKWQELSQDLNETVLAPRFQLKHQINEHLTQRFSYGLGYRAPLTFFESQHGASETGYRVNIRNLEKAHSFVYSISRNTPDDYVTFGSHYTLLSHMAYGEDVQGQPLEYKNLDEELSIWVNDLRVGRRILTPWFVEASIESFQYQDAYKRRIPTAAIESRIQLQSELELGAWSQTASVNFIGARDISRYGDYPEHYNRRRFLGGGGEEVSEPKKTEAPAFFTVDVSLSYRTKNEAVWTLGVYNLFDYTQTDSQDSPTTWHWHFDHAHLDNFHTWGPNQGREIYLQFQTPL